MHIYNNIHVLLSTLPYMFRRLLRHLQGEFYRMHVTKKKNGEHTINFSLKMAQ
jgi:hypothetical protein